MTQNEKKEAADKVFEYIRQKLDFFDSKKTEFNPESTGLEDEFRK